MVTHTFHTDKDSITCDDGSHLRYFFVKKRAKYRGLCLFWCIPVVHLFLFRVLTAPPFVVRLQMLEQVEQARGSHMDDTDKKPAHKTDTQARPMLSRRRMIQVAGIAIAGGVVSGMTLGRQQTAYAQQGVTTMSTETSTARARIKPTIILIHGAFAESSSWDDVITTLTAEGYPVVALANPLRGVKSDGAYLASTLKTISGPVVLVGHSYGGMVISAVTGNPQVVGLVFVSAFAPEPGESAADLSGRFPGGTLGPTLAPPVPLGNGINDLYIEQSKYHEQFCADIPQPQARRMAATQRPCTDLALSEKFAGIPAWKSVPSWFIFGELDKNIPAASHEFMAERARAREIVQVKGASHVVGISHADTLTSMILRAAKYER